MVDFRVILPDISYRVTIEMAKDRCEYCEHYLYDDEYDEYYCDVSLDEDEMEEYMKGSEVSCGFFKFYDEYKMVEKQN